MIYRIWARTRLRDQRQAGMKDRVYEHGGVQGKSALDAAWEAALRAEAQGAEEGGGAAALLMDISKCYERVDLDTLADAAVVEGWDPAVVAMAIGQ